MSEKKNKWSAPIGIFVGILFYLIAKGVVGSFMGGASFDKKLTAAANEINKNCPMIIDSETRLDNTIALPDNNFQYNYSLMNLVKDSIEVELFEGDMKKYLINAIKETPELEIFRKNETTMNYSYKDRDGKFISKIVIDSEDYK